MRKCEVLNDTVIAIKKGSIVLVDDKQFELARKVLKPVTEEKEEKAESLPKEKKTKKK
jgi:hypothetical protein